MQESQESKENNDVMPKKFNKLNYFVAFLVLLVVAIVMYEINESIMMNEEQMTINIKCSNYEDNRRDNCCEEELHCRNMTSDDGRYYGVFWEENMLCGCLTKDESFNLVSSLNCSEGLTPTFNWSNGRLSCVNIA